METLDQWNLRFTGKNINQIEGRENGIIVFYSLLIEEGFWWNNISPFLLILFRTLFCFPLYLVKIFRGSNRWYCSSQISYFLSGCWRRVTEFYFKIVIVLVAFCFIFHISISRRRSIILSSQTGQYIQNTVCLEH